MPRGLLVPPCRRLEQKLRLPVLQHPTEATVDNLERTMMSRDAIKFAKTTASNRKAIGPLPAVQRFVEEGPGWPNAPESMATGLRTRNAARAAGKTRGQSAGI